MSISTKKTSVKSIRTLFEEKARQETGDGQPVFKRPLERTTQSPVHQTRKASGRSVNSDAAMNSDNRMSDVTDLTDSSDDEGANFAVHHEEGSDDAEEHVIAVEVDKEEETEEQKCRRKRFKIAEELYTTEEAYVSTLTLLHVTFRGRLELELSLSEKVMKEIFMNIRELHQLHTELRNKLKSRIDDWEKTPMIGDIMKSISPFFGLYTEYMARFEHAVKTINELGTKDEKFAKTVYLLEGETEHCKNLRITQHMLCPVQRIPRYRMLLEDYIKRLPESDPDYPDLEKSLTLVSNAANKANDNIAKLENFQLVSQLLSNVSGLGSGIDSSGTISTVYIKHGRIKKMSRRKIQERFIFVFNAVVLICKIEGNGKYKCTKKISSQQLECVQVSSDPNIAFPFEIITKKCSFILGAKDEGDRESWIGALQRVLNDRHSDTGILLKEAEPTQRLGLVAPVWIPDYGVSMCMSCEQDFTAIRRRHHCRACGKVFCAMCSSHKQYLGFDNKVGRVCDACNEILSAGSKPVRVTYRSNSSSMFFSAEDMPHGCSESGGENGTNTITKGVVQSGDLEAFLIVKINEKEPQRYWCVLRGMVLVLYAGNYDKKPKKELPILGYDVLAPLPEDKVDPVSSLKLYHHNMNPWYLTFTSDADKDRWYEKLNKAANPHFEDE